MLLHIDFPNCMSHTFIFLYMLTIHFDDVFEPQWFLLLTWYGQIWNVFILSCCNNAHVFTYHSLHTLKSVSAKLEKSLSRGISNFLQTTPCPHFYPLIFGPPLLTSRKHTYLCVYSGRGIWNEIKCTFICLLLCCFIHYIKTILWNKSVPYALDKSFHSKI